MAVLVALVLGHGMDQPVTPTSGQEAEPPGRPWLACFSQVDSQGEGCTEVIVNTLSKAKTSVRMQAYSFTSGRIAQALVKARQQGIPVEVILDKGRLSRDRHSRADVLADGKIDVWIDGCHAAAHSKVIIIDEEIVIGGSFNFSELAECCNAENLLVIRDKVLAACYRENWQLHQTHSKRYAGTMSNDQYRCDRPSKKPRALCGNEAILSLTGEGEPPQPLVPLGVQPLADEP